MIIPIRVTQPSYAKPVVTVMLIVANALVFFHEISLGDRYSLNHFIGVYGLTPIRLLPLADSPSLASLFAATLLSGKWLSSMFLHANWLHIIGNMLFLWVFGENVEDILGRGKFLAFYLLCGLAAAFAQVAIDPLSRVPMVGASGAIAGVMGAYLVRFPHSRVEMLFFAIFIFRFDLPAWCMLIYWFALQLFGGVGSIAESSTGGTAFFAHVGGFVAGIGLIYLMGARQRFSRRRDLNW
jgi:membrane associated rhomboid family serine protease